MKTHKPWAAALVALIIMGVVTYVNLRGIPAMRYQGACTLVGETALARAFHA